MDIPDPLFFVDAVRNVSGFVTLLLISSIVFFFIIQIVAWLTPPNPKFVHVFGIGAFWIVGSLLLIYNYAPIVPALVEASIVGVYGFPGYFWIFSLIFLVFIFLINTIQSWKENKPLEVMQ